MRRLVVALAIVALASAGAIYPLVKSVAAASAQLKVVIVVGATEGTTASYRADADAAAAVFAKYTSNIVKVYSPNATWAAVSAASQGASVFVYMGHGSGYPNPYNAKQVAGDNGMGLNASAANSDYNLQYYGAGYMAQLGLAPNALVMLNHLCYASGDSEGGRGLPTLAVAKTRVDGYAAGFLAGNARTVIAEGLGNLGPYIDALFTTQQSIDQVWKTYPSFHNNVSSWGSTYSSGYTSQIDPDISHPQRDGDYYYRSMVSLPNLTTGDIVGQPVATYEASTFHAIAPARLLDTRVGNGLVGRLYANTPRTFQVTGRGGVPANATAVTGNVTVTGETDRFAIALGPNPASYPSTSTLNFVKGDVTANSVTVALGTGVSGSGPLGTLSATYMAAAGNTTDLVFDVTGYFTPDTTGATFHSIDPVRVLDTRSNVGVSGSLSSNTPVTFQIAGSNGIPANATAVTGNVTVTDETDAWAVFVGPDPTASPTSSSVNFVKGDVRANGVTVALGIGGSGHGQLGSLSATYIAPPGNTTSLIFDVTGYFTPDSTGSMFTPITPSRLLDTRIANGLSGKLSANTPRTFQVAGRGGVPSSATAVAGNLTVVNETNPYAIFLGPAPTANPSSSTLNFVTGDIRANGLAVGLGTGATGSGSAGSLSATYMAPSGNTTDLVFDVTGYFAP